MMLVALWYIITAVFSTTILGPLVRVGGDYRAFLSAAQVAHEYGWRHVYDLTAIEQVQRTWYAEYATGQYPFALSPCPYLPVFLIPFLALLPFQAWTGFLIWTAFNLVLIVLYLWRFSTALQKKPEGSFLALVLLSFPFFISLLMGQVSVFLLIFLGEFFLAGDRNRPFRAGLWLGGLLVKPQVLILLLPGLLLTRRFKTVAAFGAISLAILGSSVLLVGVSGIQDMVHLLQLYSAGTASSNAHVAEMMNWRALAVNLETLLPPRLVWGIAVAGITATIALGLAFFLRRPGKSALPLLGACAATCAATWHSTLPLGLLFAVPLLALHNQAQLPRWLLAAWSLAPAGLYVLTSVATPQYADNITGIGMLAMNLFILGWAAKKYWSPLPGQSSLGGTIEKSP